MGTQSALCASLVAVSVLASAAGADVSYLDQARSISASLTVNGETQQIIAPDFGPFVQSLDLSAPFPAAGGGTAINSARVGIDCQLDPNAVRASGRVAGSGGQRQGGGTETGDALAMVAATFRVGQQTPYLVTASPRPITGPAAHFRVRIRDAATHNVLLLLDQNSPPQQLSVSGTFEPGDYLLDYQVEASEDGGENSSDYSFGVFFGPLACYANCDGSTAPPVLNVNDFVCFMNRFASGESYANCDGSTTPPVLNVNDFICYMTSFAAGCP